ncbi:MAG: flagellar hook-basal body complex protein [Smithellaceae bacterium]|nr:flagellar hook-basal body complex protein [Smithellaceae bacterium]
MSSSLWIATTGLNASARQLDVIGHNIANSNTVGFKASDTYFSSMLSSSLMSSGRSNYQLGNGVSVASVATQFQQGSFESTGNATDVAIDGNGFFIVKDVSGTMYFTRTGNFRIQKDGFLADGNGFRIQGRTYADGIKESDALGDLNLRDVQVAPKATTTFGFGGLLNFETKPGETFNVRLTVYDSLGGAHDVDLLLTKAAHPGLWDVKSALDGGSSTAQTFAGIKFDVNGSISNVLALSELSAVTEVNAGTGTATAEILKPGVLGRTSTNIVLTRGATANDWVVSDNGGYGSMRIVSADAGKVLLDVNGAGEAQIQLTLDDPDWAAGDTATFIITTAESLASNIDFTYADLPSEAIIGAAGVLNWKIVGTDAQPLVSFAGVSRVTSQYADGFPPGSLTGLSIAQSGVITGLFSNGQLQKVARIVLADFRSPGGLRKEANYFLESIESGSWVEGIAASAGFGAVQANSLEISNTDMAKEFVKMIAAQRAYQANARMITTADQMQQELMNIRR